MSKSPKVKSSPQFWCNLCDFECSDEGDMMLHIFLIKHGQAFYNADTGLYDLCPVCGGSFVAAEVFDHVRECIRSRLAVSS